MRACVRAYLDAAAREGGVVRQRQRHLQGRLHALRQLPHPVVRLGGGVVVWPSWIRFVNHKTPQQNLSYTSTVTATVVPPLAYLQHQLAVGGEDDGLRRPHPRVHVRERACVSEGCG